MFSSTVNNIDFEWIDYVNVKIVEYKLNTFFDFINNRCLQFWMINLFFGHLIGLYFDF
jgi:hypothetical protein